MSIITLDTTDMEAIGDAIRTKLDVETAYKPGEMPAAILSIPSGGVTPTGTISIDSNGIYDVTQYASANVQVPGSGAVIQPLTVTQDGTYNPPAGVDGFGPVVVDVQGGDTPTLPDTYQEVEWIGFDGNQFMSVTGLPTSYTIQALAMNTGGSGEQTVVGNNSPGFEIYFYNGDLRAWSRSNYSTFLEAYPTGTGLNVIREIAATFSTASTSVFIARYSDSGTYSFIGNIYRIKMYSWSRQSGVFTDITTIRNFVPCYRKSDGVIGLYELYTNTFYTNEGTGTFTAGPDVN